MSIKKLGRYDFVRVLGKGAMGLVYEGRDPNLDRRVAIKTIRVENLSEQAAAEYEVRFRTEAHSAARLQHPHIVSVYDSDRDGDVAFLVMEFIQGDDLKYHLDKGDRYTLEQSAGIMADLLSALDYAHRQNIVHRDIKPANLLIEPSGRVKLTDFGVARIQDSGDATRTQGTIVGTLRHMAPEQVQGLPVDARADLFAAGIVLYQLLTGTRPFDADTDFAIIQQVVGHTPPAPTAFNPKLPPAMDAVVARALAKSRDQRFATAGEFASALQAACKDAAEPTLVPPASPSRSASHSTRTDTLRTGEALTGAQPSTVSGVSSVTQEIELVYWKEIKDSDDVDDIQVFLAQFPSGIYAALARRRLRKLGVLAGEDSDISTPTGTGTLAMPSSAHQMDKTVFVPGGGRADASGINGIGGKSGASDPIGTGRENAGMGPNGSAEATGSAGAQPPAPLTIVMRQPEESSADTVLRPQNSGPAINALAVAAVAPPKISAPAGIPEPPERHRQPSRTHARKRQAPPDKSDKPHPWAWFLAGLVALAGSGFGLTLLLYSGTPSALPVTAQSSPPAMSAAAPAISPPPTTIEAAVLTVAPAASVPAVASGSAPKAPAAVAVARKPAANKNTQAKQAKAGAASTAAEPTLADTSSVVPSLTPSPPALRAVQGDPRQACEDRILLSFQICMASQCARPVFVNHPTCVERRSMEQRRHETEQSR